MSEIKRIEHVDYVGFRRDGRLHREDGPAVEWADGSRSWYRNGELHREDGPAIEWADGRGEWYRNGELHREDGPAIEWADGTREWWLNGRRLSGPEELARIVGGCDE